MTKTNETGVWQPRKWGKEMEEQTKDTIATGHVFCRKPIHALSSSPRHLSHAQVSAGAEKEVGVESTVFWSVHIEHLY